MSDPVLCVPANPDMVTPRNSADSRGHRGRELIWQLPRRVNTHRRRPTHELHMHDACVWSFSDQPHCVSVWGHAMVFCNSVSKMFLQDSMFGLSNPLGLVTVKTESFVHTALALNQLQTDYFPAWIMSFCKSLICFPNGLRTLAASAPAAEDGAAAPAADAPADGKHETTTQTAKPLLGH